MGRIFINEELDQGQCALWERAVHNALKGKRGQRVLRLALNALDAMPEKKLAAGIFVHEGAVCALAAVRTYDLSQRYQIPWEIAAAMLEYEVKGPQMYEECKFCGAINCDCGDEDVDSVEQGEALDMAYAMAWQFIFENDEMATYMGADDLTQDDREARRWRWMRKWVAENLREAA